MIVQLPIPELSRSGIHGYRRWLRVIEHGLMPEYGEDNADPRNHILGAWGECVIARVTRNPWPVDDEGPDQHAPDVGCWHVRTGRRPTDRLIVHDDDPDDGKFVLVVLVRVPLFRIVGWCYGREAKVPENWLDITERPAYFHPQRRLRRWGGRLASAA